MASQSNIQFTISAAWFIYHTSATHAFPAQCLNSSGMQRYLWSLFITVRCPASFKDVKEQCFRGTFRGCFRKGLCSWLILSVLISPILWYFYLWVSVLPPTVTVIPYYFSIRPQILWTIYWALQALWQYRYIIITLLYICIPILPSLAASGEGEALTN